MKRALFPAVFGLSSYAEPRARSQRQALEAPLSRKPRTSSGFILRRSRPFPTGAQTSA